MCNEHTYVESLTERQETQRVLDRLVEGRVAVDDRQRFDLDRLAVGERHESRPRIVRAGVAVDYDSLLIAAEPCHRSGLKRLRRDGLANAQL